MAADAYNILAPCPRGLFVEQLVKKPPLSLPDTTPLYSHTAFELLAKAIEVEHKAPFADILGQRILRPLRLSNTNLLSPNTTLFGDGLTQQAIKGEPASLGLATTLSNLSAFGRAILTETLLSSTQSRRWLKPVSDTSNLRNAVGRPWGIYHFGETSTDPIIDCYTKIGSIGRYSSYLGLVPDVGVGFAILAVETGDSSADLNVHADITLDALRGINALGYAQAEENIVGTYAQTSQSGLLKPLPTLGWHLRPSQRIGRTGCLISKTRPPFRSVNMWTCDSTQLILNERMEREGENTSSKQLSKTNPRWSMRDLPPVSLG